MTNGSLLTSKSETGFPKFYSGNMSLKRPGYSLDFNQDALKELVECNPCKSTQELENDLNTS